MKKYYMDYGVIHDVTQRLVNPPRKLIDYEQKGQVYKLTHNGEGKSLSFMDKAFISFTYGGRKIEDFNLIAITVNERLDRLTSPQHEDHTTDYIMLNGQYYWGTHYSAREMTITLATDSMEQQDLDSFKNWFRAGEIRLLILSLHSNRGILARISEAPQVSLVPFKKIKRVLLNEEEKEVSIIEYKGNIQLHFVMDLPFWYAINDILGEVVLDENGYCRIINNGYDINGEITSELDEDNYKTIIEDNIPMGTMINDLVNVGNGVKLVPYNKYKYTLTNDKIEATEMINDQLVLINGTPVVNLPAILNSYVGQAAVNRSQVLVISLQLSGRYPYSGAIAGPIYIKQYEDGERITSIPNEWVKRNCVIRPSNYGDVTYIDDELHYVMMRLLPIKQGSTIKFNNTNNKFRLSTVDIVRYDVKTKLYDGFFQFYPASSGASTVYTWTADKNYYIRISLYIDQANRINFNNINSILTVNLLTFKEGNELSLGSDLQVIDYILNLWQQKNYLIDANHPDTGYYTMGISNYNNKLVVSVVKYLLAGIGSTITNNNASELKLLLYNKYTKSYIELKSISSGTTYTFSEEYYVRLYIVASNKDASINDYVKINLLPFRINSALTRFNYFYSGTAPSYPQVNFSIPIHFNKDGYIDSFNNGFVPNKNSNIYNTLCLESLFKHELKITTPSIFTSYNKVISKLQDISIVGMDLSSLIQMFRLEIDHFIIRDWIIGCINIYKNTYRYLLNSDELLTLTNGMRKMLLLYMPYVFILFENAGIELQVNDPEEVVFSKEIVVDYDYEASKINTNTNPKKLKVMNKKGAEISLIANNAKFYQWQFSPDGTNWYLMPLSEKWSGTTLSTLRCNQSKGGVTEEDRNQYYRCLVSNDTSYVYTLPIYLVELLTELRFIISNSSSAYNKSAYYGETVTFNWSAENYNKDYTKVFYKLKNSSTWKQCSNDNNEWLTLAENTTLVPDDNGNINFSFKIINRALDNCVFDVEIGNEYNRYTLRAIAYCSSNGLANIYSGIKLSIKTLSISNFSLNLSSTQNGTYTPVSNYHSFICPEDYWIQLYINVINSNIRRFEVLLDDGQWRSITDTSSNFYQTHTTSSSFSSNYYYVKWKAKPIDNNKYIRFYAKEGGLGDGQYFPDENGFQINRVISKTSTEFNIIAPTYIKSHYYGYLGENLTLEINDQNTSPETLQYQWYYKKDSSSNWSALSGKTQQNLVLSNISNNTSGFYRICINRAGLNVEAYDNSEQYIEVSVLQAMTIITNPQSKITVSCFSTELDQLYQFELSASARYATSCKWYMKLDNQNILELTTKTVTNDNDVLSTTVTISKTYRLINEHFPKFYCIFYDDYIGEVQTTQSQVELTIQEFEYFSLGDDELVTSQNWDWKWPCYYLYYDELDRKTYIATIAYNRLPTVTCSCTSNNTTTGAKFNFTGVPLTSSPNFDTDIGASNLGTALRNNLTSLYHKNTNAYFKVGQINVVHADENYRWSTIKLKMVKNLPQQAFNVNIQLKLTDDNGTNYGWRLYTATDETNILILTETPDYLNITVIEIYAKPYYIGDWKNISLELQQYNSNKINNRYNMSPTSVEFMLRGQKTSLGRKLLMGSRGIKSTQNSSNSIYINHGVPVASIKWYKPGSYNTLPDYGSNIYNVTIEDMSKFLSAMNNNGEETTYTFTYQYVGSNDHQIHNERFKYGRNTYYLLMEMLETLGINIKYATKTITDIDTFETWFNVLIVDGSVIEITITYPLAINTNVEQLIPININCETGEYSLTYNYNKIKWPNAILDNLTEAKQICYLSSLRHNLIYTRTESAGDMILYNNFIFSEQNHFDQLSGTIKSWNESDKTLCHKLTYDGKVPLQQMNINYRNYYL